MPYIIDGHNLIPKLGLRLDAPDDELELIAILQEFARLSRREVQVYFDGAPAGQAGEKSFGQIKAHFIRQGSSADAAIKAKLKKMGRAARNWTVVTSDRDVQMAAADAHASIVPSEVFAKQLNGPITKPAGAQDDKPLTDTEISEWLKLFDDHK